MPSVPVYLSRSKRIVLSPQRRVPRVKGIAPTLVTPFANGYRRRKVAVVSKDYIRSALAAQPVRFQVQDANLKSKAFGGFVLNDTDFDLRTLADVDMPFALDQWDPATGFVSGYTWFANLVNTTGQWNAFYLYFDKGGGTFRPRDTNIWTGYHLSYLMNDEKDSSANARHLNAAPNPGNLTGLGPSAKFTNVAADGRARDMAFLNGQTRWCFSFVMKVTDLTADRGLFQLNSDDLAVRYVSNFTGVTPNVVKALTVRVRGATGLKVWTSPDNFIDSNLTHIAINFSADATTTAIEVFRNGVLVPPRTAVGAAGAVNFSPSIASLGGSSYGGYMLGEIDEFRVKEAHIGPDANYLQYAMLVDPWNVVRFGNTETVDTGALPVAETVAKYGLGAATDFDVARYIYNPRGLALDIKGPMPVVSGMTVTEVDNDTFRVDPGTVPTEGELGNFSINVGVGE